MKWYVRHSQVVYHLNLLSAAYILFPYIWILYVRRKIVSEIFIIISVNIEDSEFQKSQQDGNKKKYPIKEDIRGKRKDNGEKATDDYHYERFKKQFRRF